MGSTTTKTTSTKERITLVGVQETLMVPLLARLQDFQDPNSLLHDQWAGQILNSIDYDTTRTQSDAGLSTSMLLRARLLDVWTTEFLDKNPEATVLHLACGLDSRHLRVNWGRPGVRWIDVDFPDVIDLRKKLYSEPDTHLKGDYRMIASSVTDDGWLEDVPKDRPTIAVMEGLVMYLSLAESMKLVELIAGRFPSGEVAFDASGAMLARLQAWLKPVHKTGAVVQCGLDDPKIMEECGVTLQNQLGMVDVPGFERYPLAYRITLWIYCCLPYFKTMATYLRYSF
ncbi:tetracenomycin polyketide synthesis O-methyltransferase TcmP [Pseudomassariella vexata]|uniref:Tetracenomycin polyketide synthesis O-methyltransferase TcmP n=1 Tax=Pseudomassariella vexata TaxID=1141098 RepID=A0A1Y2DB21_9PEZI|nr:tetracenomycin polyketide synthesis O-methyltransferase TcmP [Pseudomassariella vexata]ORY55855.1 tetracenomycin polyketide synthesis O-methyltransferase TcmP [Pseudomassariella vexata]